MIQGLEPREPHVMWFAIEAQDLGFTKTAPFAFENEAILDASPERVFEILATAEGQRVWFLDFVDVRWTSPAREAVGCERDVELKALTVRERFIAWEPGKRMAFTMYGMTLPVVDAMVEDLQLEPHGEGKTRFVWRAHYRPRLFMRPFHPILRLVFGRIFRVTTQGLAKYCAEHPTRA